MTTSPADGTEHEGAPEAALTHLDDAGRIRMVDVGAKPVSDREAVASCVVRMSSQTARRLVTGDLPKGDALPVARVAGIQAAKRTPELVPLCHHVALSGIEVAIEVDTDSGTASVQATVRARDRTGVEMEALTAAAVAALTIYDLVKAVQRDVVVDDLRLRRKRGGRSGAIDLD